MKFVRAILAVTVVALWASQSAAEEAEAKILSVAATERLASLYIAQDQCGCKLAKGMVAEAVKSLADQMAVNDDEAIEIGVARAKAETFELNTAGTLAYFCFGTSIRLAKRAGKTDVDENAGFNVTTLYIAQKYCGLDLEPGKLSDAITEASGALSMSIEKVIQFSTERAQAMMSDTRTRGLYCSGIETTLAK